jgi:hypothetical protein
MEERTVLESSAENIKSQRINKVTIKILKPSF